MSDYQYIPINEGLGMKTYVFPVTLESDDEGWRAFYAPLEPMGASTWGATREEALQNIQEVLDMMVEEFLEEGKDIATTEGVVVTEGAAITVTR
ncbi:MAG: type II toxin-antitoxin system HicB family antitoxin [Candidatus Tectomicrobia bacterium]|nr:type II toxin-antitoxin system HicB family antitoxin [Candidatus Tectomicrobia bacterium]